MKPDWKRLLETTIAALPWLLYTVAGREDLDVTADELAVASIHIEPGEPSYVEVFVDD